VLASRTSNECGEFWFGMPLSVFITPLSLIGNDSLMIQEGRK
jgi:hypothetical protein